MKDWHTPCKLLSFAKKMRSRFQFRYVVTFHLIEKLDAGVGRTMIPWVIAAYHLLEQSYPIREYMSSNVATGVTGVRPQKYGT